VPELQLRNATSAMHAAGSGTAWTCHARLNFYLAHLEEPEPANCTWRLFHFVSRRHMTSGHMQR